MPAAPHVPSQTPGAAGAVSGQCRGVRPWAPPGSSHDNHPLFKEPEQAVPLHYSHGNVGMERGSLSPGNNVGAGSWGVWVGCGRGCFAEDGGALRRWGLGRGPQRCWGPPPHRRAGREMGQQVRGLASPQLREKRKVRRACALLAHGSRERVGERTPCSSRVCGEPVLDTSVGRGDPSRAPHSLLSHNPQICGHNRGAGCYQEDRGTEVLPRGPCFIPPCSILPCAAWSDPGIAAPAPQ